MPCLTTKRVFFGSAVFDVNDNVYEPAEDSFLFAENLRVVSGEAVLDLGTGSGILAGLAAQMVSRVVAVDLNPFAVRCAKENAKLNGVVERISFIQGDLFSALLVGVRFDLILFNAPYLPSEADEAISWIGRSWVGGVDGRVVVDRFIAQVPTYLAAMGRVLLMQSTLTGVQQTLDAFAAVHLDAYVAAELRLPFFETLTLIEAKRPNVAHKEAL